MADVLVVGAGPAGSALAASCADQGLATVLVDRAPDRAWRATYGAWADELPPLPDDAVASRSGTVRAFALTEHVLDREYVVLCNEGLRRHLSRPDVEVVKGRVESLAPTEIRLTDGSVLRAGLVIDASGPPHGDFAEQTAVGVVLPASAGVLAPGEAVFMDWRPVAAPGDWPTFCYALPLGGGRVLVEETSLARRPGLPFTVLRERLRERLAVHGWPAGEEHELVRFPLDPPRPRGPVVTFGARAGLIHPATGYSVATALTLAPEVARAAAETPAAVQRTVWSNRAIVVHALRRRGLSALLRLPSSDVSAFFELFFRLPAENQHDYLSGRENITGTAAAMLALFRSAPWRLRSAIAFGATVR